jgi:hypothetical protein
LYQNLRGLSPETLGEAPRNGGTIRGVLPAARCLLLALNLVLLASPSWFARWFGGSAPYLIATVLLLLTNVALVASWDRAVPGPGSRTASKTISGAVLLGVGFVLLANAAAGQWLRQILIFPIDPQRADMLVVIQAGIHRLLQGKDPYAMYQVPWPATLPYGPVMWGPLILPTLAHADVRLATLVGVLFVPCLCLFAAADQWARDRRIASLAWLLVLATLALSPDLRNFISIGHTPTYWPLLALLAWLVAGERWDGAALVTGLLIVGRSTMVSLAPVLLIAVWYRARPRFARTMALLAAATLLPFLPFAIWDWPALKYALYGSYQAVIKGFVWKSTDWAQHTVGLTGTLLSHGVSGAVEIVQVVAMIGVYAACARAVRAGRRPLPWLAFALLAFSMTTLWPVSYIYLDVCLLGIAAAAAEVPWAGDSNPWRAWVVVLALSCAIVGLRVWTDIPVDASIDAGTDAGRPSLYSGFSSDERQGDVTFAWVNGTRAEMLIPRRSRRDAVIDLVCEPHLPTPGAVQQLSASLNGTVLGTVTLKDGWQHVELPAPGRVWQIGVNELTLFLSSAVSPQELGLSDDARKLSLAVDRLMVRTP